MSKSVSTDALLARIALYAEILTKDPRSTIFVQMSEAYRNLGMAVDALRIAEEGARKLPDFAPGHLAVGRACFQLGDVARARRAFEEAYRTDPRHVPAIKALAHLCSIQQEHGRALELAKKALAIKPSDAFFSQLLGKVESSLRTGQAVPAATDRSPEESSESIASEVATAAATESAQTVIEGPSEENPGAPIATATLADIYIRQGLKEKALRVFEDLLRQDPTNAYLLRRVEILREEALASLPSKLQPPVEEPTSPSAIQAETRRGKGTGLSEMMVSELERWLDAIRRRREHVC